MKQIKKIRWVSLVLFLTDRVHEIKYGVPQGSILGPMPFRLHMLLFGDVNVSWQHRAYNIHQKVHTIEEFK